MISSSNANAKANSNSNKIWQELEKEREKEKEEDINNSVVKVNRSLDFKEFAKNKSEQNKLQLTQSKSQNDITLFKEKITTPLS